MSKKLIAFLSFIIMILAFFPVKVEAFSIKNIVSDSVLIADDPLEQTRGTLEEYGKEQECTGSNAILGDVNDPDSVAWLVQKVFDIIKVAGPILVVVLSSIDFVQVIVKSDDEAMAKAGKKLGIRLVLAGLLFFIPTLVEVILEVFGFVSATCGIN